MQNLIAIILFFFPSCIAFPLAHLLRGKRFTYKKGSKIGFSLIISPEINLDYNAKIGNFNFIKVVSISLGNNSRINHFNILKGRFDVLIQSKGIINQFCKIVSKLGNLRKSTLKIGYNSIIGVGHMIDVTHNITIDDNSILAGARSQIWTHSFYHPSTTIDHWRIDGEVKIGKNVYVGSGCIICAGVTIRDNITVGAGSTISKNLNEAGLYVNQALRFVHFVPEENIGRYKEVSHNIYVKE